jgi:uncharacterized protein (DUF1684 family)
VPAAVGGLLPVALIRHLPRRSNFARRAKCVKREIRRRPSRERIVMLQQTLDLLDWKRRVFELYAAVRAGSDPADSWHLWRRTRDALFRWHPQSPLPPDRRETFGAVEYFPYDPSLRFLADVEAVAPESLELAGSAGSRIRFTRFGLARFELGALALYWLEGYGGGVFLPFADLTNGRETYGAGRYLLDSVKGADLGMEGDRLVLDFNFAYNPSCAYDGRWACPLAPAGNKLAVPVTAGEKTLPVAAGAAAAA